MASQGLEIGNHQVDLPLSDQILQPVHAFCRLRHRHQVPGNSAFVAHAVIHVGKRSQIFQ